VPGGQKRLFGKRKEADYAQIKNKCFVKKGKTEQIIFSKRKGE